MSIRLYYVLTVFKIYDETDLQVSTIPAQKASENLDKLRSMML